MKFQVHNGFVQQWFGEWVCSMTSVLREDDGPVALASGYFSKNWKICFLKPGVGYKPLLFPACMGRVSQSCLAMARSCNIWHFPYQLAAVSAACKRSLQGPERVTAERHRASECCRYKIVLQDYPHHLRGFFVWVNPAIRSDNLKSFPLEQV